MNRQSSERRENKRVNYLCECQLEADGLRVGVFTGRINDLSADGAFVDSMTWLPTGSKLTLVFRVREHDIRVAGEVRYSMPNIGMGILFMDLDAYDKAVIESFLYGTPIPSKPTRGTLSAVPGPGLRVVPPTPAQSAQAQPAEDQGKSTPVMSGTLAIVNVFDLIHMIENGALTGRLSISSSNAIGEIQFNDGTIVGAVEGNLSGAPALNKFLGVSSGVFEFRKCERHFQPNIDATSNTSLILGLLTVEEKEQSAIAV